MKLSDTFESAQIDFELARPVIFKNQAFYSTNRGSSDWSSSWLDSIHQKLTFYFSNRVGSVLSSGWLDSQNPKNSIFVILREPARIHLELARLCAKPNCWTHTISESVRLLTESTRLAQTDFSWAKALQIWFFSHFIQRALFLLIFIILKKILVIMCSNVWSSSKSLRGSTISLFFMITKYWVLIKE